MTITVNESGNSESTVKSAGAFRTISEVAAEVGVPQHVLRFWESKFTQIRPMKRGGGRRYYRPEDVDLICGIRDLLYRDGYTIKGAQRFLREAGPKPFCAVQPASEDLDEDEKTAWAENGSAHTKADDSLTKPITSSLPPRPVPPHLKLRKSTDSNIRQEDLRFLLDELAAIRALLKDAGY